MAAMASQLITAPMPAAYVRLGIYCWARGWWPGGRRDSAHSFFMGRSLPSRVKASCSCVPLQRQGAKLYSLPPPNSFECLEGSWRVSCHQAC